MELNYKKKLLLTYGYNDYNKYTGLKFTALADGVKFTFSNSNKIKYRTEKNLDWVEVTAGNNFPSEGLKRNESIILCGNFESATSDSTINGIFSSTGLFRVSGNIMSLIGQFNSNSVDFTTNISLVTRVFQNLFKGCVNLYDAKDLLLPATTLANYCYASMFRGCSSLTSIPQLPATTLANYCYSHMFDGCTSLTRCPNFAHIVILKQYCCSYMFYNCIKLIGKDIYDNAVNFSGAETCADYCFSNMFSGCTSLTTPPYFHRYMKVAKYCCEYMFDGCTALTAVPTTLNATTLAEGCYKGMFSNCTSLTSAPTLPVTTLAVSCYSGMFSGCTALTSAPTLPVTTLADSCYSSMFSGCSKLTSAPALNATTLANNCYSGMFSDCSKLISAPALNATTLAEGCYSSMFSGCVDLTSAPTLPATTLAVSCYSYMFSGCSKLTSVDIYAKTPEIIVNSQVSYANNCYTGMCMGCSSLNRVRLDDEKMWGGYYKDSYGNDHEYNDNDNNLWCVNFVGGYNAQDWWLDGVNKTGTFKSPQNAKLGYHDEAYFESGAGHRFGVIPSGWNIDKWV